MTLSTPLRDFVFGFPDLTPTQKLVLVAMAEFADWKTGENIRPGTARISDMTGLSVRSVHRARAKLINVGALIEVEAWSHARPGIYRLPIDSLTTPYGQPDQTLSTHSPHPVDSLTTNHSLPSTDPPSPSTEDDDYQQLRKRFPNKAQAAAKVTAAAKPTKNPEAYERKVFLNSLTPEETGGTTTGGRSPLPDPTTCHHRFSDFGDVRICGICQLEQAATHA